MPHVIYLHSALMQNRIVPRNDAEARRLFGYTQGRRADRDVNRRPDQHGDAGDGRERLLQSPASPTSTRSRPRTRRSRRSSAEPRARSSPWRCSRRGCRARRSGTLSGQVVMQGFIQRRIPVFVRRLVTMVPALVVAAIGLDPTRTLVISQVILSFGIPFALVPARLLHEPPRPDGHAREQANDDRSRRLGRHPDLGAQRLPACRDVRDLLGPRRCVGERATGSD